MQLKRFMVIGFVSCFLICVSLLLTACGKGEDADANTLPVSDSSGERVMVSAVENAGFNLPMGVKLSGDTMYYMEGTWDNDTDRFTDGAVFRLDKGQQEAVEIEHFAEEELLLYFVDAVGAVYSLYADISTGEKEICLRKRGADLELIYDVAITDDLRHIEAIKMGQAGPEGEVCLSGSYGEIYVFDKDGQFVCKGQAPWDKDSYHGSSCGLANAGKEGVFTYHVEKDTISFQKIDLTNGKPGKAQEVQPDSQNNLSVDVYDGFDNGIFFSDSNSLWKYDVSAGEVSKVFGWGDTTINLKDYMIDTVGVLEEGLVVLVHRSYTEVYFAQISEKNRSELAEKQTVTLGVMGGMDVVRSELEEMASAFNRESGQYEIVVEACGSFLEFQEKLIKGEGPDLIELSSTDITVLADKGVLEDLSPYFAESLVVKEEDLLPAIQRAGTVRGSMCCVLPDFQVGLFLVKEDDIAGSDWNADRFLALGESHPGAALLYCTNYAMDYYSSVLSTTLNADMETYVDWEKRECSFDDGRFASLVERVMKLDVPPFEPLTLEQLMNSSQDIVSMRNDQYYKGELLTSQASVSGLDGYQITVRGVGKDSRWLGYPNEKGVPYYEMVSNTPLGINHASEKKDGAWAFLEFLLSANYQNRKIGLPVRKDSFEKYLERTEMFNGIVKIDLSEEEREAIRPIVDNAYWMRANTSYVISPIIYEETQAVFAGDKSPEEAARIIQNRVWLYLNE